MGLIDFHVHPWTKEFMEKNGPIMKACSFFKVDVSKLPASVDDLLEGMDEAGISRSVILGQDTHATKNPSFKNYTIRNDWLAEVAAKTGDRLVHFAGVDPNAGPEAVKELKRAFTKLGARGLKIHSSANSVFPNSSKMNAIYEFCQEKGLPVLFHTGTTGLGDCEIKYGKPEFLDDVCQRFPDLRVVMAHFGWPWSDVALAVALRNPNAYIDISGWKPRYLPPSLLPYLSGTLKERFLFGTDYPMLGQKEWVDDFNASLRPKLSPDVVEKLLFRNAERLLRT
jgi:hypothetical protein